MKLSNRALKWIAMTAMLADHIGLVLFEYWIQYGEGTGVLGQYLAAADAELLYNIGYGMRIAGRISFPVYAFLLTEGFRYTRSWKKYWLRMVLFAMISQIPFSLAAYNVWIGGSCNIFFELAIGILMLEGLKRAETYFDTRRNVYMLLVLAAACMASWLIRADYDVSGILMIAAFYLLRDNQNARVTAGCTIAFAYSLQGGMGSAALAAVPLSMYNGKKGRAGNKYVFYWFYPVHLLALFLIRRYTMGIPLG